jgi:EAL domain-containing protein (putative c-di-GMP-specific phosphodiesterase class I)
MHDPEAAARMLGRLHEIGVRVCIDDFGTGYSSLSYLLKFPARTLKIDRSFVTGLTRGGQHTELVRTIVALGRNVGMDVIAEGVETAEQLAVLRSLGCDYIQGFLVAKALPAASARPLLDAGAVI